MAKQAAMYPILETKFDFDFQLIETDLVGTNPWRISPGILTSITYPFGGSKIIAIVTVTYTLNAFTKSGKPALLVSGKEVYSITKNDESELSHKSDTVYYCIKMLEKKLAMALIEKGQEPGMPKIPLDPVTYNGYMNNNQTGVSFSQN